MAPQCTVTLKGHSPSLPGSVPSSAATTTSNGVPATGAPDATRLFGGNTRPRARGCPVCASSPGPSASLPQPHAVATLLFVTPLMGETQKVWDQVTALNFLWSTLVFPCFGRASGLRVQGPLRFSRRNLCSLGQLVRILPLHA